MQFAAKGGSTVLVMLISLLCLAIGFTGGWIIAQHYAQHILPAQCGLGAWGNVHYVESITEMPESSIKVESLPNAPTILFLEAASPLALKLKLRSCELSEQQVNALVENSLAAANGPGYMIRPTDDFIVTLPPEERASLYALLAHDVRNTACAGPFRFDAKANTGWLEQTHLPPPVEKLVCRLLYRYNDMLLFADLSLVLRRFPDKEIYADLFRVLTREATLKAYLRVDQNTDLKKLAQYWGAPNRVGAMMARLKMALTTGAFNDIPLE